MTRRPAPADIARMVARSWPARREIRIGPVLVRDGAGGGSRVSAATLEGVWTDKDLITAEASMRDLDQPPLFMVRGGEVDLDQRLEEMGYRIKDPVVGYAIETGRLTDRPRPPVTAFTVWPALACQADIWAAGGVGPARLDVMARCGPPRTTILGRLNDAPAGTLFCAMDPMICGGLGMVHAVEVLPTFRRGGLGALMTRAAAHWIEAQGGRWLSLVTTRANSSARALYSGLGMTEVGGYHYRIKESP